MSNVHNVSESDNINVIECIMNINKQLAELNSKVDKLNDVAKQNEYEINDLKKGKSRAVKIVIINGGLRLSRPLLADLPVLSVISFIK